VAIQSILMSHDRYLATRNSYGWVQKHIFPGSLILSMGAINGAINRTGDLFLHDLEDLGRYYRDYVELMAHVDAVLPGFVCRVIYEDLVADTEAEVRRLLDHCGLPFEAQCLDFHNTQRSVRTASSEQVRQPLYREGLEQWKNYEPWLGPLKIALGDALMTWRR